MTSALIFLSLQSTYICFYSEGLAVLVVGDRLVCILLAECILTTLEDIKESLGILQAGSSSVNHY